MRAPQQTKHQRRADEPDARAPRPDPPALRVEVIPRRRAHQLPTEHADHVGGVDAVAAQRLDAEDGGAVPDLAGLQADVEAEGLDDRPRDGEAAGVGADEDAGGADQLADHDAQQRLVGLHEGAREDGAPRHADDADEAEAADREVVVLVGRGGEEEGQRRPVGGEGRGGEEADQARLHQHGVFGQQDEDVEEEGRVFRRDGHGGVRRRVVRHEEVEQREDEALQPQRDPVDVPPPDVLRHHAGQHARDQHPQQHPADHDAEARRALVRRRHVPDQREHELRRHRRDAGDEGDRAEGGEALRDAEADPQRGGEADEPEDEGPPFEQVAERAEEEQPGGVAGLREGGDVGGLFVRDVEIGGEFVEDRMRVVEVRDREAAGECWGVV